MESGLRHLEQRHELLHGRTREIASVAKDAIKLNQVIQISIQCRLASFVPSALFYGWTNFYRVVIAVSGAIKEKEISVGIGDFRQHWIQVRIYVADNFLN